MKAIYLIFVFMLIQGAVATTGIVMNSSDYVQYKFDTPEPPSLQPGEYIVYTDSINEVEKSALYDSGVFINPAPTPAYSDVMVTTEALDPATTAAIAAITGGAASYLMVRRRTP